MGQYVSRGGKQYYKSDDGKLYTSFQGANQARIGNTLEGRAAGAVADFLNAVSAVPEAISTAFYDPTKRFGRPAAAESRGVGTYNPIDTGKYGPSDWNKSANPDVSSTGTSGRLKPPITSPNTTFQHADDEYNRLKSQYGGPAGVEQLAMQTSLPTGFTPTGGKGPASLKDFYSAESQVGRRDIESIIGQMGYQGKMAEWAKANPMLAQREYAKKISANQAAASYGGYGPSDEAIRASMESGKFFPSAGSPSPIANAPGFAGQTSFSGAANAVPAPPQQQGAAVSAPYAAANAQAAEKTAGATGMPAFETTAQPQTTLDKVNTFVKTLFPAGVGQIFGPRY